jgi:hypothetical protein
MFPIVSKKEDLKLFITHGSDFEQPLLNGTEWIENEIPITGAILPNAFIVYFGQTAPSGDLIDETVQLGMDNMGRGYNTWAQRLSSPSLL